MMDKNIQMSRKKIRGAVAVEMAFFMIPLVIMAFGVAEFGRGLYEYNTLAKSVRDGARHVSQTVETTASNAEGIQLTVYGSLTGPQQPLLPNLSASNVVIARTNDGAGLNFVTVTITGYQFDFVFNPLVLLGSATTSITFNDIHATMRQL